MALPASGEISFNLFNTDRAIASGTQVDMAAAGTAYGVSYNTNGSNQLGMDEFYGKSIGPAPAPTPAVTPAPSVTPSVTPAPAITPAPAVTNPPIVVNNGEVTCIGGYGYWETTWSGGSGNMSFIAIGTSQANAISIVNGVTPGRISIGGEPDYYWGPIANGTWYVAVRDSAGASGVASQIVNCVAPTPTITPSVTPAPSVTPSETPAPSVTPSETPAPSVTPSETPAPSVYSAISLKSAGSSQAACDSLSEDTYYIGGSFSGTSVLYIDAAGVTYATSNWYSNGIITRNWDGASFVGNQICGSPGEEL